MNLMEAFEAAERKIGVTKNMSQTLAFFGTLKIGFGNLEMALPAGWTIYNWYEFEERAAILEFDGGFSRTEAERLAAVELGLEPPTDDDVD